MEQVQGMLWLAAVMGLLAACAFSFLFYLVFRRPRTAGAIEYDAALPAALVERPASPEEDAEFALVAISAERPVDTTPDSDLDLAADLTVLGVEDDDTDTADRGPPATVDRQDADDAAVMSVALARISAADPDGQPQAPDPVWGESDWFESGGRPAEFDDFDSRDDDLIVVWDESSGPEPRILVRRSEDDPDLTQVLMGDVIVAQVRGRANVDDDHVSLMPLSLARTLGWAHA